MSRTCPQCERSFEPKRPHHVYDDQECRYQAHIEREVLAAEASDQRVEGRVHALDDARGQVEEGPTSAQWALIAREHTMRTLLETNYFSAEDLESLGIPEHYRRSVHGLVTAFFRGPKPFMDEAGRRKSERPSAKGRKITIFRISARGRRELPKLLNDLQREIAGVHADASSGVGARGGVDSGETPDTGIRDQEEAVRPSESASSRAGVGESPTRLFDDAPPSAYDPWKDAA